MPVQLINRIAKPFLQYAPYITEMLYDIYYKDEYCIYACAPNIYLILKNYILSGVVKNPALGIQGEAEIFICATSRFEIDTTEEGVPNTVGVYVNLDGEYLHTEDNIHFFHVTQDEDGNVIYDQEWIVFANKLKKFVSV